MLLSFVYDSVASEDETADSDIDLLLVGKLSSRRAANIFGPLGRQLGREFNPVVYREDEFRSNARSGNQFIQKVLSGARIWLIGNDNELKQMLE